MPSAKYDEQANRSIVWHLLAPILPEAREAITEIGKFVNGKSPENRHGVRRSVIRL